MSKILLFANEPILATGLRRSLNNVYGLDLVGVCSQLEEVSEQLALNKPDILLMDLTSDVTFGSLSVLREVASDTKIVLWVHEISTEMALQSVSLGVRGILRRTLPVDTLIRCLNSVSQGELWFEKGLTESLMTARRYSLTRREGQLVALLSQGLKNKEIAMALSISAATVKVYLSRLFQKLGVNDRFELALYGLKNLAPGSRGAESARASDSKRGPTPIWRAPRSFFMEQAPTAKKAVHPQDEYGYFPAVASAR
jgi:DNA-binding NarL/FixJ family response regulator